MNFPEKKYINKDSVDKLIEITRKSIDDVMDAVDSKATKQNAIYNVSYDRTNGMINQITGSNFSMPVVGVDSTPELDSTDLITSGAVAAAVANLQEQIDNIQPSSGGTFSTSNVQAVSNGFEGSSIGIAEQVTE
jgi:hypothetical protein